MNKKTGFALLLILLAAFSSAAAPISNGELKTILDDIQKQYKIPGMSACIVTADGIQAMASVGVRKYKTDIAIEETDLWHLGSNTKMMTATLAAILVEKKMIKWDSTIAEILGKEGMQIHPDYAQVSLTALLSHRAGLPANIDYSGIDAAKSLRDQRLEAARQVLSKKADHDPETEFEYSNIGYIIAGAMMETACNDTWEHLITENVFEPLRMSSAGFGGIGTSGMIDQPWGHTNPKKPYPINGVNADNPLLLGPAGIVHCSLPDWAAFMADQLRGARGTGGLLQARDYAVLQNSHYDDDFGLGWICVKQDWAKDTVLTHEGSNTMFLSLVWLVPEKNLAVLVCTNEGKASEKAAEAVVVKVFEREGFIR